jgi:hypothetical protein
MTRDRVAGWDRLCARARRGLASSAYVKKTDDDEQLRDDGAQQNVGKRVHVCVRARCICC